MAGDGEIEAEPRKLGMDECVPPKLRLGALKELGRLRRDAPPERRPQRGVGCRGAA